MPMRHAVMSELTATLWYLSLPVLLYVCWRFVRLNIVQCERVHCAMAPIDAAAPQDASDTTPVVAPDSEPGADG